MRWTCVNCNCRYLELYCHELKFGRWQSMIIVKSHTVYTGNNEIAWLPANNMLSLHVFLLDFFFIQSIGRRNFTWKLQRLKSYREFVFPLFRALFAKILQSPTTFQYTHTGRFYCILKWTRRNIEVTSLQEEKKWIQMSGSYRLHW